MSKFKSFEDVWIGLVTNLKTGRPGTDNPERYCRRIDDLVHQSIKIAVRNYQVSSRFQNTSNVEETIALLGQFSSSFFASNANYEVAKREYEKNYAYLNKVLDMRRQEREAKTWDHAKTLLYRVLTTVFIGFIVFMYHMAAYKMTGNSFLVNPFAFLAR